jgi:hypothetical protein
MGKYEPLGDFLRKSARTELPMSFEEIETVIGARLPPKAKDQRAWWSNNPSNNVMTKVWLDAGYRTERVDLTARRLVFRREGPSPASPRLKQHPAYGALKDLMWIDPDYDLTQPTGDIWDAEIS